MLLAGTEIRVKDTANVGGGMRGVVSVPVHRMVPKDVAVVQLIGMPLGLMEFKEDELEIIK
jgi:hypothetical protein